MNRRSDADVIGLDVGGVLYYDEPFELAWLQGVLERAGTNIDQFCDRMRAFYLAPTSPQTLFTPAGAHSWNHVRSRWSTLVQPIPGALDAIDELAQRYELCVIANQPPECMNVLHDLGITSKTGAIVLDAVVGHSKPSPQIYLEALAELSRQPQQILMVGNRPDHDAVPILTLGGSAVILQPDDGWLPPDNIDHQLLNAYREVRYIRNNRVRAEAGDWLNAGNLAALAVALRGERPATEGALT